MTIDAGPGRSAGGRGPGRRSRTGPTGRDAAGVRAPGPAGLGHPAGGRPEGRSGCDEVGPARSSTNYRGDARARGRSGSALAAVGGRRRRCWSRPLRRGRGGRVGRARRGCLLVVRGRGLIDDLAPDGPRGLRNHLRSLAEGHMTTGLLKVLVTIGAAAVVVVAPAGPWAPYAGSSADRAAGRVRERLERAGRASRDGRSRPSCCPALALPVWGELVERAGDRRPVRRRRSLALPLDLRETRDARRRRVEPARVRGGARRSPTSCPTPGCRSRPAVAVGLNVRGRDRLVQSRDRGDAAAPLGRRGSAGEP